MPLLLKHFCGTIKRIDLLLIFFVHRVSKFQSLPWLLLESTIGSLLLLMLLLRVSAIAWISKALLLDRVSWVWPLLLRVPLLWVGGIRLREYQDFQWMTSFTSIGKLSHFVIVAQLIYRLMWTDISFTTTKKV